MRADLVAAYRSLRASASFTAVAVIVLALGIGASTAIFSVVDAVVLRGLPFDEHDRLVAVGTRRPPPAGDDPARDPQQLVTASPQDFMDWDQRQQVFSFLAASTTSFVTLREAGGEPEDLRALRATADTFEVLGIGPALGRRFTAENEVEGRHRVAVLSDALWRRRFGSDASIVGRTIALDGEAFEVVGVMPPDATYPVGAARSTDLYIPFVVPADQRIRRPDDQNFYLQVVGRLKPGTTIAQAQAQMEQIGAALREEHPEWNKNTLVGVRPLVDHIVGSRTKSWMLMLLGAVGLVLLIACVNVATLQLARATAREREVGVRAALGASRWRLIRQLLVENIVLAGLGTAVAVMLAWWGVQVLKSAMPDGVARVSAIAVDLRVLAVAAAAALATGLLTGIVPALQLSRPDLTHALKDGARGTVGAARHRFRNVLVVAEVALAVVLLVGAALFIGSFVTLMRIDPGFDTTGVLTAQVFPRFEPGQPPGDHRAQFQEIVDRIGTTPGVLHASYVIGGMPLGGAMNTTRLTFAGQTERSDENTVSQRRVTPEYHRALGIPLKRGRFFEAGDRQGSAPVVIINEAVARRFFPGQDPLGQSLRVADADRAIVGIVGDIHQTGLEAEPMPEIYLALAQNGRGGGELIIRTSGDPYTVLPAVKSAVAQVLPDVPLRNVRTMEEVLERRVAQRRLNMLLLGLFGVLGLVIAAVGIYGTLAYTVALRTREIGVRMALGASRSTVVTMVLGHAGTLVALGLIIGGAGAWYLTAAARAFLFGLEPTDARAFIVALAALAAAAALASAIPARRAASVDPAEALRAD
jgi:putative ABC transport system permease protein